MKKLIPVLLLLLCGCSTIPSQDKAKDASTWIDQRAGFIEDAVAAIVRVSVYSSEKNTEERERTLEIMHAVAGNLNAMVANGITDPDSIKAALKIKEPYFGDIMNAISSLVQVEIGNFKDNGYGDLTISILDAVSKGISDGTTTN